jgi:hypothetical protein
MLKTKLVSACKGFWGKAFFLGALCIGGIWNAPLSANNGTLRGGMTRKAAEQYDKDFPPLPAKKHNNTAAQPPKMTKTAARKLRKAKRQEAAVKIQSAFRGMQARKKVQDLKQQKTEEKAREAFDRYNALMKEKMNAGPEQKERLRQQVEEALSTYVQLAREAEENAPRKKTSGSQEQQRQNEEQELRRQKALNDLKARARKEAADLHAQRLQARRQRKEQEAAATKIQAGVRGMQARKRVAGLKKEQGWDAIRQLDAMRQTDAERQREQGLEEIRRLDAVRRTNARNQ